jgi:hypothetical protein
LAFTVCCSVAPKSETSPGDVNSTTTVSSAVGAALGAAVVGEVVGAAVVGAAVGAWVGDPVVGDSTVGAAVGGVVGERVGIRMAGSKEPGGHCEESQHPPSRIVLRNASQSWSAAACKQMICG